MSTTPTSTRPDGHPADIIVNAFAALRDRYADAPAVVERMLAGDVEANLLGRSWLAEVDSIDARLGSVIDDCYKMYEIAGLVQVADATCIIDGEGDPREMRTTIEITPAIVRRWAPVAIRREIRSNAAFLASLDERVAAGTMDQSTASRELLVFTAENERLTAELATFGGEL